jgi:SAM-dependent methyltransferase
VRASKVVSSWDARAAAYDALTRRWPIFREMALRLAGELPPGFEGKVIDLAGGAGLLSKTLLELRPAARVVCAEPAPAMRRLARKRLGSRAQVRAAGGEEADRLGRGFSAVLCSAAFHLMEPRAALASVGRALKPGGLFAFNLWWHAYAPTAKERWEDWWLEPASRALREAGVELPRWELPVVPRYAPAELERLAARAGLSLRRIALDRAETDGALAVDFMAMSPNWPAPGLGAARARVIARARALAQGPRTAVTVRVRLAKPA